MKMYCDNQVAFHAVSTPVFQEMTKHRNLLSFCSKKSCCPRKFVWSFSDPMINL